MRSVFKAFGRVVAGMLAMSASWAPAALLAVWGGAYIVQCVQTLSAPGVPIEYRYESEGGTVLVKAESYQFDFSSRQGFLKRVRAFSPGGRLIAETETVDFAFDGDVVVLRIFDPTLRINRLADGSFDLMKFLPKGVEEEAKGGAFRVYANTATVLYSDVNVGDGVVTLGLTDLNVDGADGSFLFRSALERGALNGSVNGTYSNDGRLWARLALVKGELAPLLPYAKEFVSEETFGEFASVSATSLVVDGHVDLWSDEENGARIAGTMTVEGRGLRTKETFRGATLSATLTSDTANTRLRGTVSQPGIEAEFDGDLRFVDPFRMTGQLKGSAASRDALPPILATFIDPGVEFERAIYDGNMVTDGEEFFFDGDVTVAKATFAGETTTNVAGRVRLDPDRLTAKFEQGNWSGVDYVGIVSVDFESRALSGGLRSGRGRLEPLAEHFGTKRLKGIITANAVFGGTVEEPRVEVYARGSGGLQVTDGPLMSIGVFEARGRLDEQGLYIERLTSSGENGVLTAKGSMLWADGTLDFQLDAGGVDVSAASKDVRGLGFLRASIGGTRDNPTANGRLEIYGLEALERTVPQLIADWNVDGDRLIVERLAARAGTGQVEGRGSLDLDTQVLEGTFSGKDVRLEEWLSLHTVGAVAVENGTVSGTLDDPLVTATLSGTQLFAGGVDIEEMRAEVRGDKDGVTMPSLFARSSSGELVANGSFLFASKAGRVDAEFTDVPLSKIPRNSVPLSLDGLATGKFWATFNDVELTGAEFESNLEMVNVNGTTVGQGSLFAALEARKVTAEGQIGSLERYLLLSNASYHLDTEEVTGEVFAYNLLVEDVLSASKEPISSWPEEVRSLLEGTKGLLNAGFSVSGTASDPLLDVQSLTMSELSVRGRAAGSFQVSAMRDSGVWTLRPQAEDKPMWENGAMKFWMDGEVTEAGGFDVQGSLKDLQATWLNTLFPNVPLIAGKATIEEFTLSGTIDDPHGSARINALGIGLPETKEGQTIGVQDLRLSVEDRLIEILGTVHSGTWENAAFVGDVHGLVPFSSLVATEGEPRQPMNVQVDLQRKEFKDFANFITSIDPEASVGYVEGSAWIVGLWGDFTTHAELRARGSALLIRPMDSPLRLVNLNARWDNGTALLNGSFTGEQSGTGSVDIKAVFPDLFASSVTFDEVKQQTSLDGGIALTNFRTRFTLPLAERASGATVTTTDFTVSGTLAQPVFAGDVAISDLYVRLPSAVDEESSPVIYAIDPRFDGVTIRAAEGSRLDSGNARIDFFGAGRLSGTLQNPDVSIPLTVTGGVFDLPTARVTLESGGSINIGYRSLLGTSPTARVDLDLEGRTTISARRVDNEYETYFITLFIRGDLLDQEGLFIQASSDPPDLSSEQIMAILGQKEFIEGLARHGSDQGLREGLYTFGFPTASNALTSRLARDLKLDYISLDYNPFDQAVAGIGKTIGRGLMLHASRQIAANPGERLKYEVQLTYRLPMQDDFFSRVRVSLGFDQDVPWRIRLNWARRF